MKLVRLGDPGAEQWAAARPDGLMADLSAVVDGAAPLTSSSLSAIESALSSGGLPTIDPTGRRTGPPTPRPGTVVCVGLNYSDHAAETGAQLPAEPVLFLKSSRTVVGPHDEVLIPRGSVKTDYEVELAVVIGRTARYLPDAAAGLDAVLGYAVSHDVSEREYQLERGGQWDKGKSCETFNPLGPWLVTADEVPDPQALDVRLWVDGDLRQDGSTADMVFGVGELVRYISHFMVLEPGDVINTGTPAGVALGQPDPKPFLRAGQVVECEITGLGRQRQVLGAA
ncbi:fumarylacetoacetate hydrolase family protein [uncultured Pseudokineococcus sp.]|uniref:fumarylacetoacetate hydrolase family protein n=1 Tax=uncultured Pseudokineococcus sp. TaxID=1642928 RepID=UPI00342B31A5